MKIYISGPMTGIEDLNYPAFNKADELLKRQGYDTFNPAKINGKDDWDWQDYMKPCIKAIPDCTHILLLAGWEDSRGAKIELNIARTLGLEVIFGSVQGYGK